MSETNDFTHATDPEAISTEQPTPNESNREKYILFAKLVKKMRDAQSAYFYGIREGASYEQKTILLRESKAIERIVDKAIEEIIYPKPTTGKLF